MQTLLILLIVGIILYNLGAGLYYMLVDKGRTKRTVNALTRRVAFSVLLIGLFIIGSVSGVIHRVGIHG